MQTLNITAHAGDGLVNLGSMLPGSTITLTPAGASTARIVTKNDPSETGVIWPDGTVSAVTTRTIEFGSLYVYVECLTGSAAVTGSILKG